MAGEAKREAILSAAQELLLKHGLRGTSMEAIARQARIAKPTLYAYFPDKAAIFKTLVDAVIAQWRDNFVQALQGDGDIVQRVGAALTAKNKGAMRLINASPHAAELYEAHDRVSAAQFRSYDAEVAAALEAALSQAGVVRARLLTQMLLAASFGIGHKATSPAELGPALRLLAERLIRPELPAA
ncbi:MAG TPA: helix-turn-helix domain-containing protein [Devosia sp.]|nr:helix-turn-helix domain-containing protein [Devosia sp.]